MRREADNLLDVRPDLLGLGSSPDAERCMPAGRTTHMVRVIVGFPGYKRVLTKVFPSIAQAFRNLADCADDYAGEETPGFEMRVIVRAVAADDLDTGEREEFFHV